MSSVDLSNFLEALEVVKQDYSCPVCGELCRDPVTLSKCFHIICRSHFEGLKSCPTCGMALRGCKIYHDDRLAPCIDSAKKLDSIFEKYKDRIPDENSVPNTRGKQKNIGGKPRKQSPTKDSDGKSKKQTKKDEPQSPEKDAIRKRKKKDTSVERDDVSSKFKSNQAKKAEEPSVENKTAELNKSLTSNISSKLKIAEKRNTKGETKFHIACRLGKVDKVLELIKEGVNTNTKDNAGWTPLHEVVQNGHLDLVTLLLQHNTLINVPGPSNETPLHEAVRFGHIKIAEELVKNGADVDSKNCKGETPLQLASEEMKEVIHKAMNNIVLTQGANVTMMSEMHTELDYDDIRVYCAFQDRSVLSKLKSLVKSNMNLHIETKFTKKVTHLIVETDNNGVCQSSIEVLQGIVSSLWILSTDWITNSSEERLELFDKYEVTGVGTTTNKGPRNSRYNKYKQHPGIFNGCHFYFHNFNTRYDVSKTIVLTKQILTKLVSEADGVVLRRVPNPESIPESEKLVPYHAKKDGKLVNCSHYIIFKDIYEPMYNMSHLKALPVGWLIECLEKYELSEPW